VGLPTSVFKTDAIVHSAITPGQAVFYHKSMTRLFRISLMLAFFYGAEKLLGFVRQILIARQFQLSAELDAFNAANNIPDLLFALISAGALGMAFIPVLSETLQLDGRDTLWRLFSHVANWIFPLTGFFSIIIAVFALQLVRSQIGIAPGFTADQQELVAELMRLNLIATLIFSLAGMVTAGLQANQHFFLPALAPLMYDLGMLFGVLVLSPEQGYALGPVQIPAFGLGVRGLVYGTILGALLFLGIQVPGLIKYRFKWTPSLGRDNPRLWRVFTLMGPRVLTVFCIQIIFIVQDNLASRLPTGAVTALVFGWLIMQVPETLIGTALGTALLPTLSEQIARGEIHNYTKTLNRSVSVILALTIPLAAIIGLVTPSVVAILGFDQAGIELVVWTARAFLFGLLGHALLEIAVRSFYARQIALIPLGTAFLTVLAMIILAVPLARSLGAPGIALANSIAFTFQAMLLLYISNRQLGTFLSLGSTPLRVLVGTAAGGLACLATLWFLSEYMIIDAGPVLNLLAAGVAGIIGVAATVPFIWQELKTLFRL
jgi:putative peptidoglycan lipid II flippase